MGDMHWQAAPRVLTRFSAPQPIAAVPVVHAVGGLRDTVKPFNPFENSGTGEALGSARRPSLRTSCPAPALLPSCPLCMERRRLPTAGVHPRLSPRRLGV